LRINPALSFAWKSLGVAYSNLNRNEEAIDPFCQALRINPKDAFAWNRLGVVYGKLNRYNDAIEAFRHGLRINPKDAFAWHGIWKWGQVFYLDIFTKL
jgi:tetratricopeptide (TPR) repeat protein